MKTPILIVISCLLSTTLVGCANLTSISRTTSLPSDDYITRGKAIHLDIKQRVLLAKPGTKTKTTTTTNGSTDSVVTDSFSPDMVCAEPSPDALSAFAAAFSGGVSVPAKGAGSIANALHETAASIGLRTQSITLMRDSLYRLCEAYYNGQLSKAQVMLLMSRNQDLTATVLAVEQLTGAVVAQQAGLSGSSSAASSAVLLANAKALEQARGLEDKANKAVTEAEKTQSELAGKRDAKHLSVIAKQKEIDATPAAETEKRAKLKAEKELLDAEAAELDKKVELAAANVKNELARQSDFVALRKAIEAQQDSAITTASAAAAGLASFSGNSGRDGISKEVAEKVSSAVKDIVLTVLGKQYIVETCLAVLTNQKGANIIGTEKQFNDMVDACLSVITTAAISEQQRAASMNPK